MARNDDDIERLLAEAEGAIGGRSARTPARSEPAAAKTPGRFEASARVATVGGALAAAVVFGLFAVLPFFGAFSGAAGAFVATFFIVFAQKVTGRKNKR
ncbi:MAG: hypothetical protein ACT4QG_00850 [Sporichthyaceae bacterium]